MELKESCCKRDVIVSQLACSRFTSALTAYQALTLHPQPRCCKRAYIPLRYDDCLLAPPLATCLTCLPAAGCLCCWLAWTRDVTPKTVGKKSKPGGLGMRLRRGAPRHDPLPPTNKTRQDKRQLRQRTQIITADIDL